MATRIEFRDKIHQKSVGFHNRQQMFFDEDNDFDPDRFCRKAIDQQIAAQQGLKSHFLPKNFDVIGEIDYLKGLIIRLEEKCVDN